MTQQVTFKLVLSGLFLDILSLNTPEFRHRRAGCWEIKVTALQFLPVFSAFDFGIQLGLEIRERPVL
jgi:hypothetical protein